MGLAWMSFLEEDDLLFLKRFLLTSGSLKALAKEYGISYPTVRARLDRLIAKVAAIEEPGPQDAFHQRLRVLVAEGRLDRTLARELLRTHREVVGENGTDSASGRVEL
jgi:hypothetical protein